MKVPINEVAVVKLDAPVLSAYEATVKGVARWFVRCKHCQKWHSHGLRKGIARRTAWTQAVRTGRRGYNLASRGDDRRETGMEEARVRELLQNLIDGCRRATVRATLPIVAGIRWRSMSSLIAVVMMATARGSDRSGRSHGSAAVHDPSGPSSPQVVRTHSADQSFPPLWCSKAHR